MDTPRDPHLPPPDVCDWLLSQDWSELCDIESKTIGPKGRVLGSGRSFDLRRALVSIGADCSEDLVIHDDSLEILREDHAEREEDIKKRCAYMQSRLASAVPPPQPMHYPLMAPPQTPTMDFQFFSAFRDMQDSHRELVARVELLEEAMLADDEDPDDDEDLDDDN